jgi:hypothetical protein
VWLPGTVVQSAAVKPLSEDTDSAPCLKISTAANLSPVPLLWRPPVCCHIAEKSGIPANDATTEDIYDIVWRFGLSLDETVEAQRLVEIQNANPDQFRTLCQPTEPAMSAEEYVAWYDGDDAWSRGWNNSKAGPKGANDAPP